MVGTNVSNAINIDTIDNRHGYVYRISNGSYSTGTFPDVASKTGLLIGFSDITNDAEGVQLFLSAYGRMYYRNKRTKVGNTWYDWKSVTLT